MMLLSALTSSCCILADVFSQRNMLELVSPYYGNSYLFFFHIENILLENV